MSQCHFRTIKVEEVHELDGPTIAQSSKVHPLRLVVQLDFNRVDLDVFCGSSEDLSRR